VLSFSVSAIKEPNRERIKRGQAVFRGLVP
jgi:hypothetical protein